MPRGHVGVLNKCVFKTKERKKANALSYICLSYKSNGWQFLSLAQGKEWHWTPVAEGCLHAFSAACQVAAFEPL